ncbi:unnamed protein product, partial [Symbiodinium sp. CCMP2456]
HQQLVEAQAFNEWLSNRRLRQEGESYADELGRMTEAVNRRIPQLRYAPAERAGVRSMATQVHAGRNTSDSGVVGGVMPGRQGVQTTEELEDEDGQEILRLLGRRWTRPHRVMLRYDPLSHTVLSYLCEVVQRASERSYLGKRGLKIN